MSKYVMRVQAINKQTSALEAIQKFAAHTNIPAEAKLALIEITATETLKELAPEIAVVKADQVVERNRTSAPSTARP